MKIKEYFKKLFNYYIKNETCGNKNSRRRAGIIIWQMFYRAFPHGTSCI
jgi:hypothetical protein